MRDAHLARVVYVSELAPRCRDAVFTMIVSMISMWVVRIGMSYVLKWTDMFGLTAQFGWPLSFGALGVWFAMILDWIVRSSCFVYRFRSGKWKQKRVI